MTPPINSVSDERLGKVIPQLRENIRLMEDRLAKSAIPEESWDTAPALEEARLKLAMATELAARRAANTPVDGVENLRRRCAASGFHDHDGCTCSDDELRSRYASPALPSQVVGAWVFDRYVNGCLMAEGVEIKQERTLEAAAAKAARLASRGPNGEAPVLILSTSPAAEGCVCQACQRTYATDLLVPDDVWEAIRPADSDVGGGLLCPTCVMDRAADMCGWTVGFVYPERHGNAVTAGLTSPAAEPVAWLFEYIAGDYAGELEVHSRDGVETSETTRVQAQGWAGKPFPVYTHPAPSASREVTNHE